MGPKVQISSSGALPGDRRNDFPWGDIIPWSVMMGTHQLYILPSSVSAKQCQPLTATYDKRVGNECVDQWGHTEELSHT